MRFVMNKRVWILQDTERRSFYLKIKNKQAAYFGVVFS